MSTTTAASTSRPFSKIANDVSNTSIVNTSLSNSRRLSATHTGLSTVARTRTTSLISPPKAAGGLSRPTPSTSSTSSTSASSTSSSFNVGDTSTSIARRGIPKSSTSSIARIASTSSTLPIHRRLNSLASTPPIDLATTPKPAIGGGPLRRAQKESKVEDSPGLDELVNNTTLAMADIKDMLSPLAVSKVSSNEKKPMSQQQYSSSSISKIARNLKSPTGGNEEEEEKEELENVNSSSKSALPILQRATSIRKGASSPSPTKISRSKTSTSPRKLTLQSDMSIVEHPPNRKEGSAKANANTSAANLTKDGLPALPGTRNLAVPQRPSSSVSSVTRPPPSSSSSSRHTPSPNPIISSRGRTNATTLNERSTTKLSENTEADVNDEEDFEKLLSEEGFISPARYLTADCSTLLMQDDLEKVMMTPLRAPPPSSRTGRTVQNQSLVLEEGERKDRDVRKCEGEEVEKLLQAERERVKKEILAQTAKEREVLEQRVNEEREMIQRQLAEREIELKKQSREITTLQKLLSTQAKSAVIISSLESQLSKQDSDISTIRRLKRDIDESNRSFERERKQMSLEKAKNIWKGYGKEIEIEKESVGCQLETLAGLKGLMDHIALCVERRMESDFTRSSGRVAVA